MLRRMDRKVQTAKDSNRQTVKPEPPSDLWARMDAITSKHGFRKGLEQPEGTFTATQYAKKMNISNSPAKDHLRKLVELGEIEIAGIGINNTHFYRPK
jgi:Fic family protein